MPSAKEAISSPALTSFIQLRVENLYPSGVSLNTTQMSIASTCKRKSAIRPRILGSHGFECTMAYLCAALYMYFIKATPAISSSSREMFELTILVTADLSIIR